MITNIQPLEFDRNTIYIGLLSKLKPAATKLILSGNKNVEIIELVKLTLLDLCFKQVLKVTKNNSGITFIEIGKHFLSYNNDAFELYFLRILKPKIVFPIKEYISKIYEDLPPDYQCYCEIIEGSNSTSYFNKNWFCSFFQLIKLSNKGKKASNEIKTSFTEIERNLHCIINENTQNTQGLIKHIGGNLFLIKTLNFEIFKNINEAIQSIEALNNEFFELLDSFYLGNTRYIMSDIYDLTSQIINYFSKCREN